MTSYNEMKTKMKIEMKTIQKQVVEAKKNEPASILKAVKPLCKQFDIMKGSLNVALTEGRMMQ